MRPNFETNNSFERTPPAIVKKELFGEVSEKDFEKADAGFRNLKSFIRGAYIGSEELKSIVRRCQPQGDASRPSPLFANQLIAKTAEILGVGREDTCLYTAVRSPFEKRGVHAFVELGLLDGKEPVISNLEVTTNSQIGEHGNNVVFYFPEKHLDPEAGVENEEYAAKVNEVAVRIALDAIKQLRGIDAQFAALMFEKVKENIIDSLFQTISVMKKSKRFEDCNIIVSGILKQTKEINPLFAESAMERIKNKFIDYGRQNDNK